MQANLLRTYRAQQKLSQRDLGKLVGISQAHVQRLETGRSPISLKLAISIGKALGTVPAAVFPALASMLYDLVPSIGSVDAALHTWEIRLIFAHGEKSYPLEEREVIRLRSELWQLRLEGMGPLSRLLRFESGVTTITANLNEVLCIELAPDKVSG